MHKIENCPETITNLQEKLFDNAISRFYNPIDDTAKIRNFLASKPQNPTENCSFTTHWVYNIDIHIKSVNFPCKPTSKWILIDAWVSSFMISLPQTITRCKIAFFKRNSFIDFEHR